jgi:hypothetical protein
MSWISVGIAGVGVGTKVIGGIIQKNKADKALKALNAQAMPEYSVDPRMENAFNRAEGMSNQGFTAQENAGFNQSLAMQNTAQQRSAVDMGGGNLASTINAGLQSNNIQAINQRAGQDAQLRRSNIQYADQLAGQLQSQQNLINQSRISRRQQLEQAYGAASAQGMENIMGAAQEVSNIGVAAAGRNNTDMSRYEEWLKTQNEV